MDHIGLHLGTDTAPWTVKDFSVSLRQAITRAARDREVTVAEFLHAHFTRFGVDGVVVEARQTGQDLPGKPQQTEQDCPGKPSVVDDLCRLAEAAARLAEHGERMPKTLAAALTRRLTAAVRGSVPATPPRPQRLAAPSPEAGEA
jgi:hypothetical protein